MRGLYQIPTRLRKSEWYSISGHFTAELVPDSHYPSLPFGRGILSFQPEDSSVEFKLIPKQNELSIRDNTYKIVSVACEVYNGSPTRKWKSSLYLRKIIPVNGEPYWNILIASSQVCICQGIVDAAGEEYHSQIIEKLLPLATQIDWPDGIPNDESKVDLPPVDESDLDPELWGNIKRAFLENFSLEDDQVRPELTLDDFDMDSLDAVQLWLTFEEMIDVDIDEDEQDIEAVFKRSNTLRQLHDWLLNIRHEASQEEKQ